MDIYFVYEKKKSNLYVSVNAQKYVYVRPGNTVELQCQNKSTTNEITWFGPQVVSPISKGSKVHWNSANGRISITKGYNLRISGLKKSDIGKYKCIFTTEIISFQHDLYLVLESMYSLKTTIHLYFFFMQFGLHKETSS